jgi:hypothetical protein
VKNRETPPTMVNRPHHWKTVFLPSRLMIAGMKGVMISAIPEFMSVIVAVCEMSPITYLA